MGYILFKKVREIIARETGISPENILPTSTIFDNQDIDSLTHEEIIMDIEDTFNIEIPDEIAKKMTSVIDIIIYLKTQSNLKDDLIYEPNNRIDDFCRKLINGEIQVVDIPDEDFDAVAERVMFDLPVTTMEAVVHRLEVVVSEKEKELAQKKYQLMEIEKNIRKHEESLRKN